MAYRKIGYYATNVCEDSLKYIPSAHHTLEMTEEAIKRDGRQIKHVLPKFMSDKLCLMAVEQNGKALEYIYDKTEELCMTAVKQSGRALRYVPPRLQTKELVMAAIENAPDALMSCKNFCQEVCDRAVELKSEVIAYVPREFKTPEMVAKLKPFISIGKFVPPELMTDELKDSIEKFYKEKGYVTLGPLKVDMICLYTSPCKHSVVLDGSVQLLRSTEIGKILAASGITHDHFKVSVE